MQFIALALLALSPARPPFARSSGVAAPAQLAPAPLAQTPGQGIPASPKDVATEISIAVGAALRDGNQRLSLVIPEGLCFGIFGKPAGKQELGNPDVRPPTSMLRRCERELAYILVEVFQLYAASCAVVFRDAKQARAAETDWKAAAIRPGLVVGGLKELAKPAGFGARAAASGPPKVVIVVRPDSAALAELEPYAKELGESAVVVLLNPQPERAASYFATFTLQDNPHPDWAGGLLYQAHPGSWMLGAAGISGAIKVHGTSKRRPTLEEIDAGFDKVTGDTNWFSGGGAAAALRRRGVLAAAAVGE